MNYAKTTMVPNRLFELLPTLTGKEIKVLLIILRQTVGWVDSTGARKLRDWLTNTFIMKRTGLSPKSVSRAISSLIEKKLIRAEDENRAILHHPMQRQQRGRIFYSCRLQSVEKNSVTRTEKRLATKLTLTKLNEFKEEKRENKSKPRRLTDMERYLQIIEEKRMKRVRD